MRREARRLNTLSVLHFVMGGLMILTAVVPGFYVFLGVIIETQSLDPSVGTPDSPEFLASFFIVGGAIGILLCWLAAALQITTGVFLGAARRPTFCLAVAGLECILIPLGTLLGVFTIIALSRPEVRALFDEHEA